jgi:general secretion pathway protein L
MNTATSHSSPRSSDLQFSELIRVVRVSFGQLHHHPALAWMTPQLPVRLVEAGGGQSLWIGTRKLEATPAQVRAAPFTAIELPPHLALTRRLVLPPLSQADLRDAVALEVRNSNPFEVSDLVWGYRSAPSDADQIVVTAVLASRRLVSRHLEQVLPQASDPRAIELWAMAEDGSPVVLQGFGEAARVRRAARGRWLACSLMALAVLLATAVAVTPTVQLHLRARQADAAYQALQQRAGPAIAEREALVRGREDLANLREVMSDHIDPVVALDMLTQLIPDDTWLQRVQAQGSRFTLSGQTPNAAALMNTLSGHPGLRDVRAPAPATRGYGTTRETFVVEFTIAPELLQRAASRGGISVAAAASPAPVTAASGAALPQPAASAGVAPQPAAVASSSLSPPTTAVTTPLKAQP